MFAHDGRRRGNVFDPREFFAGKKADRQIRFRGQTTEPGLIGLEVDGGEGAETAARQGVPFECTVQKSADLFQGRAPVAADTRNERRGAT